MKAAFKRTILIIVCIMAGYYFYGDRVVDGEEKKDASYDSQTGVGFKTNVDDKCRQFIQPSVTASVMKQIRVLGSYAFVM